MMSMEIPLQSSSMQCSCALNEITNPKQINTEKSDLCSYSLVRQTQKSAFASLMQEFSVSCAQTAIFEDILINFVASIVLDRQ